MKFATNNMFHSPTSMDELQDQGKLHGFNFTLGMMMTLNYLAHVQKTEETSDVHHSKVTVTDAKGDQIPLDDCDVLFLACGAAYALMYPEQETIRHSGDLNLTNEAGTQVKWNDIDFGTFV